MTSTPPRLRPLFVLGVVINWAMVLAGPFWAVPTIGDDGWLFTAFMAVIASVNTYRLSRQRWQDEG
ncbi:MAG: hypothetical protein EXR52_00340 [Dehalococcoidia bacterium]|nr:hypothetical protein [Dehalococcoidia bacterium]